MLVIMSNTLDNTTAATATENNNNSNNINKQ